MSIHQVQCGPLKLTVPTSLTLHQKARRYGFQPTRIATFKGSLNITNKGDDLVTFKVLSKDSKNLQVQPAHGLIKSNHSIRLNVITKDVFAFGDRVTNFSLLVLATACKITDVIPRPKEIPLLWNELIYDGSCAFVDTFKIGHFNFIDMHGMRYEISSENDPTNASDIEGYLSSSSYPSQCQTDSEDGNGNREFGDKKKLGNSPSPVEEMNYLTKHIEETNNTMRNWNKILILFMIVTVLLFFQRSFGRLELEIVLTQNRK